MSRIIAVILAILILIGAIALGFVFFRNSPKVKVITITKEAKFTPTEIKLANDEVLKIKNEDTKKHTIRNVNNNTNIVSDLEPGKTSGEIVFDDNSRNQVALVDNKNVQATALVGKAPSAPQVVQQTPTPAQNTKPAPSTQKPAAQTPAANKPLPNTGPGDLYIYPLALIFGLAVFLFSQKLLVVRLSKYQVSIGSKTLFVRQPETTLIHFPQENNS